MDEKDKLEFELNSIKILIETYMEKILKINPSIIEKQQLLKITDDELKLKGLKSSISELSNQKMILENKLYDLKDKEYKINEFLNIYNSKFIGSNGTIDLYKKNLELDGTYNIYLHQNKIKIGEINYLLDGYKTIFGNVGYTIIVNYRGNGYAYQALCILADYLSLNNIQEIVLTVKKNNIESIKTLDKFKSYALDTEVIDYYIDSMTGEKNTDIFVYIYKLKQLENEKRNNLNKLNDVGYEQNNIKK